MNEEQKLKKLIAEGMIREKTKKSEINSLLGYNCRFTLAEIKKTIAEIRDKQGDRRNNIVPNEDNNYAERISAARQRRIERAFESAFPVLNGYSKKIQVNDSPVISNHVEKETDWSYYSKSYQFPKVWKTPVVSVPIDRLIRLERTGKLVFDNIINLKILSEKTVDGVTVYNTESFSMKKRELLIQKYWIAEKNGVYYHAQTEKKAIAGIYRKIKNQNKNIVPDVIRPDTDITVSTYKKITGACSDGIRAFKTKNGITKKSIPAKKLLPLLQDEYGYEKFKSLCAF